MPHTKQDHGETKHVVQGSDDPPAAGGYPGIPRDAVSCGTAFARHPPIFTHARPLSVASVILESV